ncbi:hypothetical protein KAU11_10965, partial [Candidatus Babeliales bacterium]|nr:hypothetical protein [Candidatus Babeliales bacterium]
VTYDVNRVDITGRLYINGVLTDPNDFDLNLEPRGVYVSKAIKLDGDDPRIVFAVTGLDGEQGIFKCTATKSDISEYVEVLVLKEKASTYEIKIENRAPIYSGTVASTLFTCYKDGALFEYDVDTISVVSNDSDKLTVNEKTPDVNSFIIDADNLVDNIRYEVKWIVDEVILASEVIIVNHIESSELILGTLENTASILDDQAATFTVFLLDGDTLLDISDKQLTVEVAGLTLKQSAASGGTYRNLIVGIDSDNPIESTEPIIGTISYTPEAITYSTKISISVKRSVTKPYLEIEPVLLNLNTDLNGDVINDENHVLIKLLDNGVVVPIDASFLGVDLTINSDEISYTKVNLDDGVKVTVSKITKDTNLVFKYSHNNEFISGILPILATEVGSDTFVLSADTYSSSMANILNPNPEEDIVSQTIGLSLIKNTIGLPGQALTMTYNAAELTAVISEVGGGKYSLKVQNLKVKSTTVTIAYDEHSSVSILVFASNSNVASSRYMSTATDTLTLGAGDHSLTVGTDFAYSPGLSLVIAYDSTNYMTGLVKSYIDGVVIITVDVIVGAGTYSAWDINLTGGVGIQGIQGIPGADG